MDSGLGFVQPMFFVGVVEDRYDPRFEGRVRVRAFGVHGSNRDIPTEELPWATLILGHHDVNFTPPPLNAWVFGFFIDGREAQQPMILGLIPSQASELINPAITGWGSVPAENYDRDLQKSRARDLGKSPLPDLATGEFLEETYNEALETNRVKNIPIAGGCARGHNALGNGNIWSNDIGEDDDSSILARQGIDASGPVSFNEAEQLALDAGFSPGNARIMAAIAMAESSGNPRALNRTPPDLSYGLWQMNLLYGPDEVARRKRNWGITSNEELFDPRINARAAFQLFNEQGFGAWSVYKSGAYRRFLGPSEEQAALPQKSSVTRAEQIRTNLARIQSEIDKLESKASILVGEDAIRYQELIAEKEKLEAELARLETSGPTEGTSNEPYSGYANPSNAPGCVSSWEEPASGYSARYPYNRVIETASGHSIELDDTPGGERIMIWHRSGSYVQITGTSTTHKNMSDSYHINERNNHVYIGGNNIVTIEGDSYVLVKGDKVEEIEGNYKQIVHGNIMIGGAKRVEINGAAKTDIRSSSLGLESNVENLNVRTGKNIIFESGESINLKSKNIRIGAEENMSVSGGVATFLESINGNVHVKSKGNILMTPEENFFLKSENGFLSLQSNNIRMDASESVFISSKSNMNINSGEELLIASEGGSVNINASDIMGINAKDLFLSGSTDVNINAGQILNATSQSDMNLKSGGAGYFSSTAVLNLFAGSDARLTGANAHITGAIVYIDDEVQLANGLADPAVEAEAADQKEPLNPAEFSLDATEKSNEADSAETPSSSVISEPAVPPDLSIRLYDNTGNIPRLDDDTGNRPLIIGVQV